MKKWASAVVATASVLTAVLSFNAARFGSRQIDVPRNDEAAPAAAAVAQRLAQAVRFQTVSHQDPPKFPGAELDRFQAFLSGNYPLSSASGGGIRLCQNERNLLRFATALEMAFLH